MALYPKGGISEYLGYTDPRGLYGTPAAAPPPSPYSAAVTSYTITSGSWAATEPIKPNTDILLSRLKAELSTNVANGNNDTELAQTYAKYFKQLTESIRKECRDERF